MDTAATTIRQECRKVSHDCSVLELNSHMMQLKSSTRFVVGSAVRPEVGGERLPAEMKCCLADDHNPAGCTELVQSVRTAIELSRLAYALLT